VERSPPVDARKETSGRGLGSLATLSVARDRIVPPARGSLAALSYVLNALWKVGITCGQGDVTLLLLRQPWQPDQKYRVWGLPGGAGYELDQLAFHNHPLGRGGAQRGGVGRNCLWGAPFAGVNGPAPGGWLVTPIHAAFSILRLPQARSRNSRKFPPRH